MPCLKVLFSNVIALTICTTMCSEAYANGGDIAKEEAFRPEYHFTPEANWMNDPNGMVYYAGEYHLFYQYHPNSTVWGPMHWGHAVSQDMLNWKHLPIALYPDQHGAIFSGSVVVDWDNTSGFGGKSTPPMVAIFTYHNEQKRLAGEQDVQTQGLAYSLDKGRSWKKHQYNPVLSNPKLKDFRDPKVSWLEEQQKWIMVVTLGDQIGFYSSKNLRDWNLESTFGQGVGEHAGVWECPDLIRIKVAGSDQYKYVLLVSIVPGAPNGGSGTQYFVGDFDGKNFVLDSEFKDQLQKDTALWLDYGTDNYAGVTFANIPASDGRSLFMGWMNNWLYATKVPTVKWRGAMTIPRSLTLGRTDSGYRVFSQPIDELANVSANRVERQDVQVKKNIDLASLFGPLGSANRLRLQINRQQATDIQLVYGNKKQQQLLINLDVAGGTLSIDRRDFGKTAFHPQFSGMQKGPIRPNLATYSIDVLYDDASVEIFINDGELVMTALTFPTDHYEQIQLNTSGEVMITRASLAQIIKPDGMH